ncbi:MAG: hypothetical protein J6V43_04210, partial [Rikenellaceae bacterium]|nr:hypothetical protein [Rikenellaceae bacterium]
MKKLSMMLTLIATVMMSIVGCKPDPQEPVVKAPTITVAEASVDAATMKASVEVTPSENTADWYWKVDTANAAGEYTKVSGNAATTIEVTVEYDTEYTFTAYAENKGGKSAEAKTVFVGPAAPVAGEVSLTVSEPSVNEESMKVVITVTPSENTAKWFYALTPQSAATVEPNYLQVDGNEVKTLTLDIVANEKYIFKAYAEDAEGNSSEPVSTTFDAPTKEVEEESGNGELVKLELKNLTSVSVDADVLKYKECVRYVAGAVFKEAYNENRFISAAQNSLKPNDSYPYVQYNSATTSKVWTEMDLVKDGLISKAENSGIVIVSGMTYVVAVYAEDAEGNYKVYTEEFTAPAAVVDGTVDVKLTIDNIGMTDVTATITTDSECRIITGTRMAVGSGDNLNANTMSDEEIKQYLAANAASVPSMFYGNETIKFDRDMGIDTDYIV